MTVPLDFENVKTNPHISLLQLYLDSVPAKPYCSDDKTARYIKPKELALKFPYIQHNPPFSVSTLVIDHDDSESHYIWDDYHAPPPNFAVMSKKKGFSHLNYMIRNKVYKNNNQNIKAFRLLCAIEKALIKKLKADPQYSNLMSKNPIHDDWVRYDLQIHQYDLHDFFDYLDLPKIELKENALFEFGLGRNCTVFDELRHIAYSQIREFSFEIDQDLFIKHLFDIAYNRLNLLFETPLSEKEVFGIAKSVGRWTHSHYDKNVFKAIQSARGKKSGIKRLEKASQLYREIKELKLKNPHFSNRTIAEMLKVSKDTVRNAFKYIEPTTDDKELFEDQPELF